ncbi:tripartite tricarboxylate transporter substrate binding protein [Variovorax sp. KK3]|uniref:Bug family tripartite tricarboxylate transporter substrate binding protein n=1 Tax=Variovorax sp. KK3 TaxID=1855728 RepID=UPI00097C8677|nr:tripartite tricarboxylate transporter substrate binding protein [Variovorax sp. KK3]
MNNLPTFSRRVPAIAAFAASAAFAAVALTAAHPAAADTWPSRPITMIVPYSAGGNVDVMARWVAPELARRLGQPVVIDNVVGAGGVLGTERATRAKPDGYTLLLSVESSVVIARMVTPQTVKYNGLKDLEPVTLLGSQPLVLVGKPELAARSAGELFADIQRSPGKYSYATSGVGTSLHLGGEMLKQQGGVSIVHVPYKAGPQIVTDLAGNQIELAVLPLSMVMPQVQAGKIKAYGLMAEQPSAAMPGIAPLAAVPAWKGANVSVWQGIFAPVGTDKAIIARLNQELGEILRTADIQKKFDEAGVTRLGLGPKEFAEFLKSEDAKFSAIVRRGQIRAD